MGVHTVARFRHSKEPQNAARLPKSYQYVTRRDQGLDEVNLRSAHSRRRGRFRNVSSRHPLLCWHWPYRHIPDDRHLSPVAQTLPIGQSSRDGEATSIPARLCRANSRTVSILPSGFEGRLCLESAVIQTTHTHRYSI